MPEKKTQLNRRQRPKAKAEDTQNAFVADICNSMDKAIGILNSNEKITLDRVNRPPKLKQFTASDIADIRTEKMKLSQSVFALLLNVSLKTVQAWEQNVNRPNGAALRLLNIMSKHPNDFKEFVFGK